MIVLEYHRFGVFVLACWFFSALSLAEPSDKEPDWVAQKLSIVLDEVHFQTSKPPMAISWLKAKVSAADPSPVPERRGLSFIANAGALDCTAKAINYHQKNIVLGDVLRDLARLMQVDFHVTTRGVVMTPPGGTPSSSTETKPEKVWRVFLSEKKHDRGDEVKKR